METLRAEITPRRAENYGMQFAYERLGGRDLQVSLLSRWARFRSRIPEMKVGTRLALGLLACLTPVVSVYTYDRIRTSAQIFEDDLKRETRATELALNAAFRN